MEDIMSSEILEKEILEDARKKAQRILKNADTQIAGLTKEWMEKTKAELDLLSAEADAKKAMLKKEMETAFPLETKRRKLRFMDGIFEKLLEDFFIGLPRKDLENVLLERAKAFTAVFAGKNCNAITARYAGISQDAAEKICATILGTAARLEEAAGFSGCIINTEGMSCHLTVDELLDELREFHREKIMNALLMGGPETQV